jgi:osmotically-inducible protein OsmY
MTQNSTDTTGLSADELLQRRVLEELEWDPMVDAARIGVTAKAGTVSLWGQVGSYAERVAAQHAAERIRGVNAIAVNISVELPGDKKRSDTDIAERAAQILRWSEFVPDHRILVEVEDGWVTLRGDVDWQYQKAAAEAAVRQLSGVCGITNAIVHKPRIAPADVKRYIEEAFVRSADLNASLIEVSVDGDTVTLSGKVTSLLDRNLALGGAWAAPGVRHVEDRIQVGS